MIELENLVIGAGPAGLQLAYCLAKRGEPYLVIERSPIPGSFFEKYPVHGKMISINKRYTGYCNIESQLRYDWNSLISDQTVDRVTDLTDDYFPSRQTMVDYCQKFATQHDLSIRYGQEVVEIGRASSGYQVLTSSEEYCAQRVFIGTGVSKEFVPDIEGIEHCTTYGQASLNKDVYRDKSVLIIGKGNSAFETADHLIDVTRKISICGPKTVKLAWASHYVGDLRAVNNNFLDTYLLKAQNNILDGDVRKIEKNHDGLIVSIFFSSRQMTYRFIFDHVIFCTGFSFDSTIFTERCRPSLTRCGKLPMMSSSWESTDHPSMYFIGTLMQMRDRKKTMSGFIHGFRHNILALDQILFDQYSWESQEFKAFSPEKLVDEILERISTSSSLFLQPGFLVDLFQIAPGHGMRYWRDVPKEYAADHGLLENCYMVSLEYRPVEDGVDPLALPRGTGVDEDFYLHPIIRHYLNGQEHDRYVLMDDLDNDWSLQPEHRERLLEIAWTLSGEASMVSSHVSVQNDEQT